MTVVTCAPRVHWQTVRLDQAVEFLDGSRVPLEAAERQQRKGDTPYYGASGVIDWVDGFLFDEELVLLAEDGANILSRSSPIAIRVSGRSWVNNHAHVLRPLPTTDPDYLASFLETIDYRPYNTGSAQPKLNKAVCASIPIKLPPLSEQQKIAKILRTWDEAIEHTDNLVRFETQAFRALRRRLFVSSKPEVPLSEMSTRITTKVDGSLHTVMTISAKTGFVAQADKYRRDMAGASLANYILLRRGEFAYNKGNSLTYPQGCIYALKEDSALVPNVYYSFRLRPDLNSSYYEHFFASGALNRQLAQRITSGVRGNGLLNLNADDFFSVKVPVPDRAVQDGVAHALTMGAREIELLKRKVELLRIQKRGLMQKLLTGQLRVKVAAEMEPGGPNDN